MRIENNLSVNRVQPARSKLLHGIDGSAGTGVDTVELSTRAADIRAAMEALAGQPEVREERVTDLRAQLQDGSYDTAADALAAKLLQK